MEDMTASARPSRSKTDTGHVQRRGDLRLRQDRRRVHPTAEKDCKVPLYDKYV